VLSEDEALQTVSNDALYMLHNAGDMSFNQIAAASVQMQIETASLQVDMSMKISVVESSKGALETLMKNQ
jgi:type III secretion inner rod protein HrpB2